MEEFSRFQAELFDRIQAFFRRPLTPVGAVDFCLFFVCGDGQCLFHLAHLPTGGPPPNAQLARIPQRSRPARIAEEWGFYRRESQNKRRWPENRGPKTAAVTISGGDGATSPETLEAENGWPPQKMVGRVGALSVPCYHGRRTCLTVIPYVGPYPCIDGPC